MKRDRPPTLADIAEHGGVSLSTVSYVLSGKRSISDRTRKRVLKAIEDLEYRPNARAQALASGATRALALLLPSPQHRTRTEQHTFVAGAALATSEADYSLVLSTSPARPARVAQLVEERRADGVILMEIELRDRRVERLRTDGHPFSVIGHPDDSEGVSYVDVDFDHAVRSAVEHLAELGHKRIVLFTETTGGRRSLYGPAFRARAAFAAVTAELGVEGHEVEIPRERDAIYKAARAVIAERRPTAAVALGTAAPAVMAAASHEGLRIPDDFSLVGFLVPQLAELPTPSLTNVDFPAFEMGQVGAEMLISRLAGGEDPPTQLLLRPPLTVRESTARVPRRRRPPRSASPSQPPR
jgi:DNA-binding LacI/PurR family transcriptional regulator